jgi:uncharacterized surface protein with fasciclin (FAS1) repeats
MKAVGALLASALMFATTTETLAVEKNIVQTAADAGTFGTLLAAATAAGLADELAEVDGLTVFAPNDAAFAKLPPGTVANLLQPQNRDKLRAIIAYHILPARVFAADIAVRPKLVETLNGCERVRTNRPARGPNAGKVTVDAATVIAANIRASNGVIHVIDSVLLPDRACP